MKSIISIVTVAIVATCLFAAQDRPNQNTLTDKEKADGWILLFEGKETKGWTIEGDAKVADGVIVIGGKTDVTIKTADTFGKFKLRFEYRKQGEVSQALDYLRLRGAQNDKKDVWNEISVTAELKAKRLTIRGDDNEPGVGVVSTYRVDLADQRDKMSVNFKVPAGGKLLLRNIKLMKQ